MKLPLRRLLVGGIFWVVASASHAAAPANDPTPTPAANATMDSLWTQPDLTGNWGGVRSSANVAAFAPFANLTAEIWDNARGGAHAGLTQDMLLTWGFNADLEKIIHWDGASVNTGFNWVQGQSAGKNSGAFNDPSGMDAANQVRVYNVYLQQALLAGQLTLKAGQMGADDDFFIPTGSDLFLNGSTGSPPTLFGQTLRNHDVSVSQYPVDGPGAVAHVTPSDWPGYALAGVYASDPGPDTSGDHGFGWRASNSVVALGEAGWRYTLAGRGGAVAAGAFYNDGQFTNARTGGPARGIYGSYIMTQQNLWVPPPPAARPATDASAGAKTPSENASSETEAPAADDEAGGPAVFAFAGWAGPDDRVGPAATYGLGLTWKKLLPGYDDEAGVAALYTGFSPDYTRSLFNPNGAGVTTAAETDLEFTYQIQITPWFSLQPDAQIFFNPANAKTRATAVTFGARAVVTF